MNVSRKLLPLAVAMILTGGLQAAANAAEDFKLVPGARMGEVKLGMKHTAARDILGKANDFYILPDGTKVEVYDWKTAGENSTIKVFYRGGRVAQITTSAVMPITAGGINIRSSYPDIRKHFKYWNLREYKAKDARIDYYDTGSGIGFIYTYNPTEGEASKHLNAIVIHWPRTNVIADAADRLL